jgi:hypothetical protein
MNHAENCKAAPFGRKQIKVVEGGMIARSRTQPAARQCRMKMGRVAGYNLIHS